MLVQCKFCGFQIIADRNFLNEEDASHYATMHCGCTDAVKYQREHEEKEKRDKNRKRIENATSSIESFCKTKGFYFTEEMREVILQLAERVLDNFFDSATVKFGQIKISVSKNAKGVMVFKRNYSETNSEEVV